MNKIRSMVLCMALLVALSGCLLTSPYWNQEFEDHTEAINLQAFTTNKDVNVKFECAQAFHGGLYPSAATTTWTQVANVKPAGQALLDPIGGRVYGAGKRRVLPAACWRLDPGNGIWYSAVRATQNSVVLGTEQNYFHTFTNAGLECLGRENGEAASWFGWFSAGCQSGAQYAIFRAVS